MSAISTDSIIDVRKYGAVGDGVTDDYTALSNAAADLTSDSTMYFPPGTYLTSDRIICPENLNNVRFTGFGGTAKIQKAAGFGSEFLLDIRRSDQIYVDHLRLTGLTTTTTGGLTAGEQGLYLASVEGAWVHNCYIEHFGDAGIRATTSTSDPSTGTNCKNIFVYSNYIYNCGQVTTTPAGSDDGYGGVINFHFFHNTVDNIHLSVKISTRHADAEKAFVLNNIIKGNTNGPCVEISSFKNVRLAGNHMEGAGSNQWTVNVYPNSVVNDIAGWDWHNIWIQDNIIESGGRGIRVNNGTFGSGPEASNLKNIVITGNLFKDLTDSGQSYTVSMTGSDFDAVIVKDNVFDNIATANYVHPIATSTNTVLTPNVES